MKKSSALRRLFVLSGVLIAFLLVHDPGFVTILSPDIELPSWHVKQPCANATHGRFQCHVLQRAQSTAPAPLKTLLTPWRVYAQSALPSGFSPADIQNAYKLNTAAGGPIIPTVAVIVAYDDPNIEADLGVYRSTFGLPPCTTANGCFAKVDQQGGTSFIPRPDRGWASEAALAVEMVSAACPRCRILLVEAQDSLNDGLFASMNGAATHNVAVILTAYGTPETADAPNVEAEYFIRPGIAIVAPNGSAGYEPSVEFPASSQYVTAVGGTTLTRAANTRGWDESVWGSPANGGIGAGSGCSGFITKPAYQSDTGCSHRTVGDVAAVADPNTGVAVYDSYGANGWVIDGGTDVAAAIVAGIFGLAGPFYNYDLPAQHPYATSGALFDVTTGANASSCGINTYLCRAQVGYDAPSGLGTPNGIAAFSAPAQDFSISLVPAQGATYSGGTTNSFVYSQPNQGGVETLSLTTRILSPTVITSASVSPSTINAGSSAALTISSDPHAASGKYQVEVIARGTQTIHTADFTLKLNATPPAPPHVTISVAPVRIQRGQSATLTWSSSDGPNACYGFGAWSGPQRESGTLTVSPAVTGTYNYQLNCYNDLGFGGATATLTVTAPTPVVTIAVNPARITVGQTTRLSWKASDARTCLASDSWTGSEPATGQEDVAPRVAATYRYTLTCAGAGGTISSSAVLSVQPLNR